MLSKALMEVRIWCSTFASLGLGLILLKEGGLLNLRKRKATAVWDATCTDVIRQVDALCWASCSFPLGPARHT